MLGLIVLGDSMSESQIDDHAIGADSSRLFQSLGHTSAVPWPVLTIAEQALSAARYKAQLDAEQANRYPKGLRGFSMARAAMMKERCERAAAILRGVPGGLSEVQLAAAMGLNKSTVRGLAQALVAQGAPYGVMRTPRGDGCRGGRFRVI